MAGSLDDNKEPSETQPVLHGGDSPGPPASNTNSTNSEEGTVSALGPPPGGSTNRTDSGEWATSVLGPPITNTNRTNIRGGAASAPAPPAGSTKKRIDSEGGLVEPSFSNTNRTNTRDGTGSVSSLPEASISNFTNTITTDNSTNSTNIYSSMDSSSTDANSSQVVDSTVSNNNETVVSPRMTFDATTGSCPSPFHPVPELEHGCYYVPDDFENKKKTFEDAEKSCQSLHDLSHLIHTETKEVS